MRRALSIFVVFFAVRAITQATTYYISPTGNDSNNGTSQSTPWKRFSRAITGSPKLAPGDTLNLLNGTYSPGAGTGFLHIDCNAGANNGSSGSPITVQAVNERQALIQGDGSAQPVELFNCSYWNIIGLHVSDIPFAVHNENDGTFDLINDSHLLIRRNILDHSNYCFNNHLMPVGPAVIFSVIEENEFYYYHRHSISTWTNSHDNEIRRNYINPRNWGNSAVETGVCTPYPTNGNDSTASYADNNDTWENNIVENASEAYSNDPEGYNGGLCTTSLFNIQWLGNIALSTGYGLQSSAHSVGTACVLQNISAVNDVFINQSVIPVFMRSAVGTVIKNVSIFNTANPPAYAGNYAQDNDPGENGAGSTSTITNTEIIPNLSFPGYTDSCSTNCVSPSSMNISNSGSQGQSGSSLATVTVTNPILANPAGFGSCYLWVPDGATALKGKGVGGADVGANVLYQYIGGTLTTNKLWDTTTGAPLFAGATVAGLNDMAANSACVNNANFPASGTGCSLFDIANRLNINKNGCTFPSSYGVSATPPSAPSGLAAIVN
jgi:hypothetical protein